MVTWKAVNQSIPSMTSKVVIFITIRSKTKRWLPISISHSLQTLSRTTQDPRADWIERGGSTLQTTSPSAVTKVANMNEFEAPVSKRMLAREFDTRKVPSNTEGP